MWTWKALTILGMPKHLGKLLPFLSTNRIVRNNRIVPVKNRMMGGVAENNRFKLDPNFPHLCLLVPTLHTSLARGNPAIYFESRYDFTKVKNTFPLL